MRDTVATSLPFLEDQLVTETRRQARKVARGTPAGMKKENMRAAASEAWLWAAAKGQQGTTAVYASAEIARDVARAAATAASAEAGEDLSAAMVGPDTAGDDVDDTSWGGLVTKQMVSFAAGLSAGQVAHLTHLAVTRQAPTMFRINMAEWAPMVARAQRSLRQPSTDASASEGQQEGGQEPTPVCRTCGKPGHKRKNNRKCQYYTAPKPRAKPKQSSQTK